MVRRLQSYKKLDGGCGFQSTNFGPGTKQDLFPELFCGLHRGRFCSKLVDEINNGEVPFDLKKLDAVLIDRLLTYSEFNGDEDARWRSFC